MPLIKTAGNKLIAGNGIFAVRPPDDGLRFLTYFKNMDLETGVDIPVVGSYVPMEFYPNSRYSHSTLNYNNYEYDSLTLTNSADYAGYLIVPNGVTETNSLEFIYKSCYLNTAEQNFIWLGPGNYGIRCINTNGSTVMILIDNSVSYSTNLPFVGNNFGMNWFRTRYSHNDTFHAAFVSNKELNKTFFYMDGNLLLTVNKYVNLGERGIRPTNETGGYFQITQAALWNYDLSLNNHVNYPIPTKPYR